VVEPEDETGAELSSASELVSLMTSPVTVSFTGYPSLAVRRLRRELYLKDRGSSSFRSDLNLEPGLEALHPIGFSLPLASDRAEKIDLSDVSEA
jgi:hypothetical protein